ncbi:hypothetical protein INT43_007116 [Umbelopsis isabellina]|uniref:T-cell immunomodulatory protein TIP C2 domain-containing protein n=1 Tax=Mortierella isabellina TaxID=91625 RepID=A0A8H7PX04_MORIS|nr:hypothetical protein INT43_007116 [Umbelopsis isabellina]
MLGAIALYSQLFSLGGVANAFQYPEAFPKSKLYQLSPQIMGLEDMAGTIAAFGDFNGDKYTDLFVLSTDQSTITIYTWKQNNFTFVPLPNPPHIAGLDFVIENVVPGDFTYDGQLDVLVMGRSNPNNAGDEIKMRVYKGNGNDTIDPNYIGIPSAKLAQPMVADISGDMKSDLLGYAWDDTAAHPTLSIWNNIADPGNPNSTELFNVRFADLQLEVPELSHCIKKIHSTQIWYLYAPAPMVSKVFNFGSMSEIKVSKWSYKQTYRMGLALLALRILVSQGKSDKIVSQNANMDVTDGDGSVDILFPVCNHNDCQIHIAYNQQMPLCDKSDDSHQNSTACRQAQNLCVADPNFKFNFDTSNEESYSIFDLKNVLANGEYIVMDDSSFKGSSPVPIRLGDYNLDGYPDLLFVTNRRALLMESVLCNNKLCTQSDADNYRRSFRLVSQGSEALSKDISNPRQAAFFDIAEDGTLDILVLQSQGSISNGVCPGYCPTEPRFPSTKPYGVNYPGATFKFTVLDTSGVKRAHQVSQLSQTGYLSLQTPYSLFGLGRTNNYIEEMFAGTTMHQVSAWHRTIFSTKESYQIRNSYSFLTNQQMYTIPQRRWKVELYIQPADYIPWVFVVLAAAAAILATVVATLNWMEKREDRLERRKALHIVNFDAL